MYDCLISFIYTVAAGTGYSSHRLDFVSESYGAAKAEDLEEASKKKDSSAESLWDVVRQETITTVTTKRVKSVFDDEDEMNEKRDLSSKEYKSKRELMEDYTRKEGFGDGLRYRSRV